MWWPTPRAAIDPWLQCAIDWDATIAYRAPPVVAGPGRGRGDGHRAARHGPGLADLAGADPPLARRGARTLPGALVASGCGTDHLAPEDARSVDDVIRAYEEQMAAIEALGGRLIVMASRALARVARSPADYERVYDRVLSQARAAGDPALAGRHVRPGAGRLLGQQRRRRGDGHRARRHRRACRTRSTASRSRCSTRTRKSRMRRRLPPRRAHVHRRRLQLCRADRRRRRRRDRRRSGHSDALLGIFDAIAPAASAALAR